MVRKDLLPVGEQPVHEQDRCAGMWRIQSEANAVHTRHRGLQEDGRDRCAGLVELAHAEHIGRHGEGHFSGCDQIGEQGMALAHLKTVLLRNVAEQLQPLGFTHMFHHGGEPVGVASLDGNLALPLGVEQVFIGLGPVGFRNALGVHRRCDDLQARAEPFFRRGGLRHQLLDNRRRDCL